MRSKLDIKVFSQFNKRFRVLLYLRHQLRIALALKLGATRRWSVKFILWGVFSHLLVMTIFVCFMQKKVVVDFVSVFLHILLAALPWLFLPHFLRSARGFLLSASFAAGLHA